MRLERLHLENFRGFEELDITFDPKLTVLVGVNGSGKSTILRACSAALHHDAHPGSSLHQGLGALRTGAASGVIQLNIDLPPGVQIDVSVDDDSTRRLGGPHVHAWPDGADLPLFALYEPKRSDVAESFKVPNVAPKRQSVQGTASSASRSFADFTAWFRELEDLENQRGFRGRDLDYRHPALETVRNAVRSALPQLESLHVERAPSMHLAVKKLGTAVALQKLSEGERSLIAMIGDIARRLAIANPHRENPTEAPIVLMIDEIDLHLHPGLQRTIIGTLQKAFPAAQLIVTTHSPQVLASVPRESIRLLQDFKLVERVSPTLGRDTNAILKEVFGVDERPADFAAKLHEAAKLIDEERFDEAKAVLASLEHVVGEHDKDVIHLSSMIDFLQAS